MDSSEAGLDEIEAQRTMDVSRDQQEMTLIYRGCRTLSLGGPSQSGQDDTTPFTIDTKCLPELSELYNLPSESVVMNLDILCAMRAGNKEFLERNMTCLETPMACFKNNKGDSILHIAAAFGHHELVNSIVSKCPSLLLASNWNDQIPLHMAARAGHSEVVKALVAWVASFSARLTTENRKRLNPYVLRDKNGDTPLHLALKKFLICQQRYELRPIRYGTAFNQPILLKAIPFTDASTDLTGLTETAACLVNADQYTSFLANKDGVSSLYLAVEAGNASLVNAMLNKPGNNVHAHTSEPASQFSQLEGKKSLVHAALKSKNRDVLDIILKKDPSLVNVRDEDGRTCLSVAASVGFHEGLCMLLDTSSSSILDWDDDGSCPIHMAVEKDNVNVFNELVKRFPDSLEQLNKKGQNIFHIAAKSGNHKFFRLVDTMNHLMAEQDVDGNTPVHLATINWRPKTIRAINSVYPITTKVLILQNADGLTPLDIAQNNLHPEYVFRERMTLMFLLSIYHPKGITWLPPNGMTLKSRSEKEGSGGKYKDFVQVLLVVAALVATVTFAAGFTVPGGFNSSDPKASFNSSDPKPGMAILADSLDLTKFLLFDAMAMYSSIIAIVALIWAQLGDQELTQAVLFFAIFVLYNALNFMFSAFSCGVLATVKSNRVLQWTLWPVFYFVFFGNIVLILPYIMMPSDWSIHKSVSGFFLYVLVSFVNENDDEKNYTTSGNGHKRVESNGNQEEK